MAQITVPKAPYINITKYSDFRGVDFSQDPSLVDRKRSPFSLNMISDNGGNPVKRRGWRVVQQLESPVHNIWRGEVNGSDVIIAHAGTKIYKITDTTLNEVKTVGNSKGTGFFMRKDFNGTEKGCLWFTAGGQYYYYDGTTCDLVSTIATRPTVLISRNPTGGGVSYQEVNLLTGKRCVSFLGNSSALEYILPDKPVVTIDEVRIKNASNEWEVTTAYTSDLTNGKITFSSAHAPVVAGEDNVEIDYTVTNTEASKIENCTVSAVYGYNASNRVFLSGNSSLRAYQWYSDIFDPTYFGDLSYQVVGAGETSIMGYTHIGQYLGVIKEDNQQDSTIFLVSGQFKETTDGTNTVSKIVFNVQQGVAGVGAISKYAFATLGDEPLFLSREGVYAVASTYISYDKVAKNRSYFIDKKLVDEANLDKAVACEWNGYYILAINTHCYVLDSRHTSGNRNTSDYGYEAYYWENVPAVCFLSYGGNLYFGTADGKYCKFNTDIIGSSAYNDGGILTNNVWTYGSPITAEWATPNDADVGVHYYKTLNKKGCLAVLSPFARSSCTVYYVVDGNPEKLITSSTFDIFDWEDIDFERFTFNSNDSPQELYFNKKQRKYKRLQFILRNDELNEAFGIHEIIKTYTVGNFSKNRRQ